MSIAIFWIAVLPTITIFLVAVGTSSRLLTTIAALLVALIGALVGNPIYASIDIGAAVIALVICWVGVLPEPRQKTGDEILRDQARKVARQKIFQQLVGGVAALAIVAFFWDKNESRIQPPSQNPVSAPPTAYSRCSGDPNVVRCEEAERQRRLTTDKEILTGKVNLEQERTRNMAEVNRQVPTQAKPHNKPRVAQITKPKQDESLVGVTYDPPGGNSVIPTTLIPSPTPEPNVFDPGGHQGFPPECRWLSQYQWSCK